MGLPDLAPCYTPFLTLPIPFSLHSSPSAAGHPPPTNAGPYYAPPPTGYGQPPPYGYPPSPPQQPQQQAYPPPMGLAGMPPGYYPAAGPSRPQQQPPQPPKPPAANFDVEAQQAASYAAQFAEKTIRAAFVRKVFILVFLQLSFTVGIGAIFLFVVPVNEYIAGQQICTTNFQGVESCYRTTPAGQWVFYTSWALTLVTLIALMCSTTLRRRHPWNLVAMSVFTLVMSVQVGCIVAWWSLSVVLEAVAVTGAAVIGLTLAAIFIPWDLTKRGNILAMAGMVVFFIILMTFIVGFWYQNKWWYLAISAVVAVLFSVYLVYDIQMVLGNKQYKCSPDEYVFAATQIYLDVIILFLNILNIIGIASS